MKITISDNLPIESIFLIISIIFGFLFIFLIPPFQGNDEVNHFSRAFQLSRCRFISQKSNDKVGDHLPSSIVSLFETSRYEPIRKNRNLRQSLSDISKMLNIKTENDNVCFTEFANTSVYHPLAYIGPSTGIFLSERVKAPLLLSFYFGRLFNLLLWILILILKLGKY